MCFSSNHRPTIYDERRVKARKQHECFECQLPIRVGEQYLACAGLWDGDWRTYRLCATCEWLRERVAASERKVGCGSHEAYPLFGELYEALDEGHGELIGMVSLEMI